MTKSLSQCVFKSLEIHVRQEWMKIKRKKNVSAHEIPHSSMFVCALLEFCCFTMTPLTVKARTDVGHHG